MKANIRFKYVLLFLLLLSMTGCGIIGEKTTSLSVIYAFTAALSLFLLIAYCIAAPQKDAWLLVLFTSVAVVNAGYLWLSVSSNLAHALMANRLSYLGSVFLPLSMLMIILRVTCTPCSKKMLTALLALAVVIFLIAGSPGILPIYYKEVSFEVVNNVSHLHKVYGPLHPIYLFYLVGYFGTMITVISQAIGRKRIETPVHAVLLVITVFVNIGVWLIEQLSHIEFEMLSVSYIISELFLLGVHMMATENSRLRQQLKTAQTVPVSLSVELPAADNSLPLPDAAEQADMDRMEIFAAGLTKLTQTERTIYNAHIARFTTKEIMAALSITENTLKFHNKNIYSKLGVSSRKELLELNKQFTAAATQDAIALNSALHSL